MAHVPADRAQERHVPMEPVGRCKVLLHVPNSFLNLHRRHNYKSDPQPVELCRKLINDRRVKQFTFLWQI